MIVDSEEKYNEFINVYRTKNLIVNVLGRDDRFHPHEDELCAVFITNVADGKMFVININHPDCSYTVSKNKLMFDLNNFVGHVWTFDKKKVLHYFSISNLKDINICDYIETGKIIDASEHLPNAYTFYKQKFGKYSELNCAIPLSIHITYFENLCDVVLIKLKKYYPDDVFDKLNTDFVSVFYSIESNGLKIDPLLFQQHFGDKDYTLKKDFAYTEYNLFTSTGRPSNRFGHINYAALKKADGCRKSFISRHGSDGCLFMVDYNAYHPRLIAQLVRYELPVDVYSYLGTYYFNKSNLTDDEIKAAKTMTFQALYGNIPEKYSKIPFFLKIKEYIEHRWNHFNKYGYVETPVLKRQITPSNIDEPNPNKLFNYILQASETEYNVNMLKDIVQYCTHKITKPILYTYDSVLFDVNYFDGADIFREIKRIMSPSKQFPVKCYKGANYNEMELISV